MKKYHFVYITTNINTGKQYIGDHSTDNLDDEYLGSGLHLKRAISKSGKEKFKREILELFETREEAFNAQEKYINEYNTLTPNGYNISPKGGNNVKGCHSDITRKKISNSLSNLPESIKIKYSVCQKGKKRGPIKKRGPLSKDHKDKISRALLGKKRDIGGMKNKKHSKNSKEKISQSMKGKNKIPLSEEHKDKISKSLKGNKNPNFGKKISKETKEKISHSMKNRNERYIS